MRHVTAKGEVVSYMPVYLCVWLCATVIVIGAIATTFIKSQTCYATRIENRTLTSDNARLRSEANTYRPVVYEALGLRAVESRRIADRLVAMRDSGRLGRTNIVRGIGK